MNLIGYLITVVNLQQLTRMGGHLKDISVHIATFEYLKKELLRLPGYTIEAYRNNGLQRHGDLGVYVPNNLRDFIFKGIGNPDDEGIIIMLHYEEGIELGDHDEITYFIHGEGVDTHTRNKVIEELKGLGSRRNKRSLILVS